MKIIREAARWTSLLYKCRRRKKGKKRLSLGMFRVKVEENAVLCSCFDLSCQCHHRPEDHLYAVRLVGEDSDVDLYGWRLTVKPLYAPWNLYLRRTAGVFQSRHWHHLEGRVAVTFWYFATGWSLFSFAVIPRLFWSLHVDLDLHLLWSLCISDCP